MATFNPDPQFRSYKVTDADDVTAQVTIGEAQQGGWAMKVTGSAAIKGSDDQSRPLGKGSTLAGNFLQVEVTVVDVRPQTNRLSAVVTIGGGPSGPLSVLQTIEDNGDGDIATFSTVVVFQ